MVTRGVRLLPAVLGIALSASASAAPPPTAPAAFIPGVPLSENFDELTPPALPPGWVASNALGPDPLWASSTNSAFSPPNSALVDDPATPSDKRLDSAPIRLLTNEAFLTFGQGGTFAVGVSDERWDGGVLEISIDGGDFQDIVDAGGSFLAFAYDSVITGTDNPLAGRSGWTEHPGEAPVLQLPPVAGSTIVLRWRLGSSSEPSVLERQGWFIDDVKLCDGFDCSAVPLPQFVSLDSSGNGVWEPFESIDVRPYYFNDTGAAIAVTGMITGVTGPGGGADYKINGPYADYGTIVPGALGTCVSCYILENEGVRITQHWDAQVSELLSNGLAVTWPLHIGSSFDDVPAANQFYRDVETVFHFGVTGGCGGTSYCPDQPALRKQMAVFLLKAFYGSAYAPPPAVGIFADVPAADPFAPWIENLYTLGITGGCSTPPLDYCPDQTVLRQQMAVFLLKTAEGSSYVPPPCQGIFTDVACPSPFADWIEDLHNRQIAAGCGGGDFCPAQPNTRGQMSAFLVKTFGLVLYGP